MTSSIKNFKAEVKNFKAVVEKITRFSESKNKKGKIIYHYKFIVAHNHEIIELYKSYKIPEELSSKGKIEVLDDKKIEMEVTSYSIINLTKVGIECDFHMRRQNERHVNIHFGKPKSGKKDVNEIINLKNDFPSENFNKDFSKSEEESQSEGSNTEFYEEPSSPEGSESNLAIIDTPSYSQNNESSTKDEITDIKKRVEALEGIINGLKKLLIQFPSS